MSKKGLSFEEKRTRMLSFFHEKREFFQLKELERLCQKEKGITTMSVKEVLQSLVDDGLVDTDKIGTCVYFWAFPSKLGEKLRHRAQAAAAALAEARELRRRLEAELADVAASRTEAGEAERARLAEEAAEVAAALAAAEARMRDLRGCDPDALDGLVVDATAAHAAANRWTDNAFALTGWLREKFPSMDRATLAKQFGISEDMDYVQKPDIQRLLN